MTLQPSSLWSKGYIEGVFCADQLAIRHLTMHVIQARMLSFKSQPAAYWLGRVAAAQACVALQRMLHSI